MGDRGVIVIANGRRSTAILDLQEFTDRFSSHDRFTDAISGAVIEISKKLEIPGESVLVLEINR